MGNTTNIRVLSNQLVSHDILQRMKTHLIPYNFLMSIFLDGLHPNTLILNPFSELMEHSLPQGTNHLDNLISTKFDP